jgi:Flp pilus assembly pilin Flp
MPWCVLVIFDYEHGWLLRCKRTKRKEARVIRFFKQLWQDERGQDIAEYAVMLAVVLVIVVGTIRLIGANANNVFSSVASSISQ